MPDLLVILERKWKLILGLTLLAGVVALIAALFSPKLYLSTATALPVNSQVADKARVYNDKIEVLYSDLGSPDELDRMEGTALLDTLFIATATDMNLATHYGLSNADEKNYRAAHVLKKNSSITRSGYGELKVNVWDKDRNLAAALANALLQKIQSLHQHLQSAHNALVLQKLNEDYGLKQTQYRQLADSTAKLSGADAEMAQAHKATLLEEVQQEDKLIAQYQLALNTNPPSLLTVEPARPALRPDKPRILSTVLFTIFAALVFSFLLALFLESRKSLA